MRTTPVARFDNGKAPWSRILVKFETAQAMPPAIIGKSPLMRVGHKTFALASDN